MCITAIANMQQASTKEGNTQLMFSRDKDIIPYINQYWEAMTTMPRRVTQSWYATIQRALVKDIHVLFSFEEGLENGPMFGLINNDLLEIKPNYDAMIKGGSLKITEEGLTQSEFKIIFLFEYEIMVRFNF